MVFQHNLLTNVEFPPLQSSSKLHESSLHYEFLPDHPNQYNFSIYNSSSSITFTIHWMPDYQIVFCFIVMTNTLTYFSHRTIGYNISNFGRYIYSSILIICFHCETCKIMRNIMV